jgi:prepilin-type N-terminal cleavage/methylation domain-containing protein
MTQFAQKTRGFTLVEFAICLAIVALFLGANNNVWQVLFWSAISGLLAVWCCAVWLTREGSLIYTSGVYPSPKSSKILSGSKTISGIAAKLHGLLAMGIGALLSLILPTIIFALMQRA